ncbi:MAG: type II toxin-antitoxin system prevent-host-death family antitoxin [Acidobacteria bacterium]|nr:type II toxin-antitoxin system prevent-host-death family antitoxin [Acidobacteriota bacterium]
MEVNLHVARTKLSQLVECAIAGEEVIIAKAGKPMVRLVPIRPKPKRVLGSATGTITYKEGWDDPVTLGPPNAQNR